MVGSGADDAWASASYFPQADMLPELFAQLPHNGKRLCRQPKPSFGGVYVSYKYIGDNTGLANFKKIKPSSMAAHVSCKAHGDKMAKVHSSPRKAINKTKEKKLSFQ